MKKRGIKGLIEKSKIYFGEPMRRWTSFRIGGPAEIFLVIEDLEELRRICQYACKQKMPLFVLGGGTNLLVRDKGIKAIVVKLGRAFSYLREKNKRLIAGASLPLSVLMKEMIKGKLKGAEFLSGIPGTIAGAVFGNAGTNSQSIGDFVAQVKVMDKRGRILIHRKPRLKFSYRKSTLPEGHIILEVALEGFSSGKSEEIKKEMQRYLSVKKRSQPLNKYSAGCIFKNPLNERAGRLIHACGLKGRQCGGAIISPMHANFILNVKEAHAADVLALMRLIKNRVYEKFKIRLSPEIKIIGR